MTAAPNVGGRGSIALAAMLLVVGAFCLAPLAANPGAWCADELDLQHTLAQAQPLFSWSWFVDFSGLFYRPLGYGAFAAQLAAAGGDAVWIHAASIAHHLVNVGLCALLFRRLGAPPTAALLLLCLPTAIE